MIRYFFSSLIICICIPGFSQVAIVDSDFEYLIQQLTETYHVEIAYAESLKQEFTYDRNLDIEGKAINQILDEVFSSQHISYIILDDNKLLIRKENTPNVYNYQEKIVINGQVKDKLSGQPLPYASVYIVSQNTGTITKENGEFSLECEKGQGEVTISYLGYETLSLPLDEWQKGKDISLSPRDFIIDEVTIVVTPPVLKGSVNMSDYELDAQQFRKISAAEIYGKDLILSLQSLPGVGIGGDKGGEVKLRGSDPSETLIVMDDIPLYRIDHYYGIFSCINPYYVQQMSLYKNSVPVEYESRNAGMLELKSKNKVDDIGGTLEADLLKVNGYLEIPLSDNISLLAGGRINHTNPFDSPISSQSNNVDIENIIDDRITDKPVYIKSIPDFDFYDINGKINWQLGENSHLALVGLRSMDNYNFMFSNVLPTSFRNTLAENNFRHREEWENEGISLSFSHHFNEHDRISISGYTSAFKNREEMLSEVSLFNRFGSKQVSSYMNRFLNDIDGEGFTIDYSRINDWQVGVNYQRRNNIVRLSESDAAFYNPSQESEDLAGFAQKELNWENLKITGGVRAMYYGLTESTHISPLVKLNIKLNEQAFFKGSATRLYQNLRELTIETRMGQMIPMFVLSNNTDVPSNLLDRRIPIGESNLFMVGGGWKKSNFIIDIEAYQKDLNNTVGLRPEKVGFESGVVVPDINTAYSFYYGKTKVRGIDLSLTYDTKRYFSIIAYTYSKSTETYDRSGKSVLDVFNGQPIPSENDRRHQLNWLHAYTWNNFTFSLNTVYNSGKPYISFEDLSGPVIRENLDEAIKTLPDYFRMDLSTQYNLKWRGTDIFLRASVYNLTNRENVSALQQVSDIPLFRDNPDNRLILGAQQPYIQRLFNVSLGVAF